LKTVLLNGEPITPSKVICVGRNYADHIAELNNEMPDDMVVFLKPNSAISDELMSFHHEPLHYEGEICLMVIGGEFSAVGFGLDLTKRKLQGELKSKGLPWERAKAFDSSAVMSEFVSLKNTTDDLALTLLIDDQLTQQGGVDLMLFKPNKILELLKQDFTLEDGDIVMTGTPKGVGLIQEHAIFKGVINQGIEEILSIEWPVNSNS